MTTFLPLSLGKSRPLSTAIPSYPADKVPFMLQYNDLKHLSAMTEAAADEAERLRKLYRRKTKVNNELRQRMLSTAVGHIEDIMVPVRSEVGKLSYREVSPEIDERLRAASKRAQLERHKLLKMLGVRARH